MLFQAHMRIFLIPFIPLVMTGAQQLLSLFVCTKISSSIWWSKQMCQVIWCWPTTHRSFPVDPYERANIVFACFGEQSAAGCLDWALTSVIVTLWPLYLLWINMSAWTDIARASLLINGQLLYHAHTGTINETTHMPHTHTADQCAAGLNQTQTSECAWSYLCLIDFCCYCLFVWKQKGQTETIIVNQHTYILYIIQLANTHRELLSTGYHRSW